MSTFQSKSDGWLVFLLTATALVESIATVAIWMGDSSWVVRGITSPVLAASAIVLVWTLLGTEYAVTADVLEARSGPFRWTIPLSSIQSVQPSRSLVAGPALSLDRLRIETRAEALLISPRDREGLVAAIVQSEPALQREGDGLLRRAP